MLLYDTYDEDVHKIWVLSAVKASIVPLLTITVADGGDDSVTDYRYQPSYSYQYEINFRKFSTDTERYAMALLGF